VRHVQSLETARLALLFLAFGGSYAIVALAAARFPAYANLLSAATAVVSVAAFDPNGIMGAAAALPHCSMPSETSFWTAAFAAVPFLIGAVLAPRLSFLALSVLAHSVSTRTGVPVMCFCFAFAGTRGSRFSRCQCVRVHLLA
jgi:hypothetical protein